MPCRLLNFGSEGQKNVCFDVSWASPIDTSGNAIRLVGQPSGATIRVSGLFEGQSIEVLNRNKSTGAIGNTSGIFATSGGCFEVIGDQTRIPVMPTGNYETVLRAYNPGNAGFFEIVSEQGFTILGAGEALPPDAGLGGNMDSVGFNEGDRILLSFTTPGATVVPSTDTETAVVSESVTTLPDRNTLILIIVGIGLFLALSQRKGS